MYGKAGNIPLFSFCVTKMISSLPRLSSPADWPAKSYKALYLGSVGCAGGGAGATGGGGGGGARVLAADAVRAWVPVPFDSAATVWGIALGCDTAGCDTAAG